MKIHNQSDKINISFIYKASEIIKIECDINDKFEKVINELSSKLNIEKSSLFFLYNGNLLKSDNFNETILSLMNSYDKQIKEINILVYRKEDELEVDIIPSDDINIMLIIDSQNVSKLQGKMNETLKTIIERDNPNIISDLDKLEFIYRNKVINLDNKFEDIADKYDKKINGLTINVNHKEKVIIKFINDKFGEKRIICLAQDKIGEVIKKYLFENGILDFMKKIEQYYFKYKNIDINLEKTINELYNDNNKTDNNDSMHKITSQNINSNELREIEIKVIEKSFCQKYYLLFIFVPLIVILINGYVYFMLMLKA